MVLSARAQIVWAAVAVATMGVPRFARAQSQSPGTAPAPAPAATSQSGNGETIPVPSKPVVAGIPERHTGKRLRWDPAFNRMDAPEMVVTGIAAGVALAAAIAPPLKTGWKGGILFDDAARNALRIPGYKGQLDARDVTDVGLALITSFPILVDSMIVAYWYRGSNEVALQMTLIDAEAIAVASALQGAATFFSGRERPYGQNCGTAGLPEGGIDCQSSSRNRSFFSGHSTLSFTSAALICAHHESLELFETAADHITCAAGFAAAATIATLRVVSDMHYVSDVLTGAVIGTAVGLGIPLLHHYRKSEGQASAGPQVQLVPVPDGLRIVGIF